MSASTITQHGRLLVVKSQQSVNCSFYFVEKEMLLQAPSVFMVRVLSNTRAIAETLDSYFSINVSVLLWNSSLGGLVSSTD